MSTGLIPWRLSQGGRSSIGSSHGEHLKKVTRVQGSSHGEHLKEVGRVLGSSRGEHLKGAARKPSKGGRLGTRLI